jgi:uncharacterized membrane protein YtjA (UPF0391 family)
MGIPVLALLRWRQEVPVLHTHRTDAHSPARRLLASAERRPAYSGLQRVAVQLSVHPPSLEQAFGAGVHWCAVNCQATFQALPAGAPPTRRLHAGLFWELVMLHYAVVFLVIALVAAIFGFGGIAAGAVGIAKILFFVFVIMAVVTFLVGLLKSR